MLGVILSFSFQNLHVCSILIAFSKAATVEKLVSNSLSNYLESEPPRLQIVVIILSRNCEKKFNSLQKVINATDDEAVF